MINNNVEQLKLSIIIPVYNVEKFINACLESIFSQGLNEECFEVILVNDGTKDGSMEVIKDILNRHTNIIILEQNNQGQSVARNNGLHIARGEYILMIDSDDLLVNDSLAFLLNQAISSKVDLVVADFLTIYDDEIIKRENNHQDSCKIVEKTGEQLFLEDLNPHECFIWRTLYRADFLKCNNIEFVVGSSPYEDVPFTHECYLKAKNCCRTSKLLNIYRRGHESSTYSYFDKNKAIGYCRAIKKTWSLIHINGKKDDIKRKIVDDVFLSFSVMMCLTCLSFNSFSDKFDVIEFINKEIPDLNFNNGCLQKCITYLLKNRPRALVCIQTIYWKIAKGSIFRKIYYRINYKIKNLLKSI
jgi:glycosyltransferase involved in cell wall biosynthesis